MIESNPNLNKKIFLAVTMSSNFLNPLMGAAVNVALPKIGAEFSMSAVGLSWVTMSFLLASSVFLVPFGKISDSWGRMKMFLYSNILFALSSLFCAFSFSSDMLSMKAVTITFTFLCIIGIFTSLVGRRKVTDK